MGSKSPSTPDIRQLPANTGTNTIANNQSMIQRGFPVITDGNNNITSGLRRNDGSLVPIQGTPFKGETFNQVPEQYREGFAEFMRNNPKYRIGGQAISYATLPDGNQIQFGDTGGASGFREYLKTLNTPNGTGTQMPIGGTPLPAPIQPTNPVTGNTSPIGGSQQDFDAYMNSYVNDLINQRMKNVFGGIMSSFS